MTEQHVEINLPLATSAGYDATTRFEHDGKEYILFAALKPDSDPLSPSEHADEHAFLVYGHRQFEVDGPNKEKALEVHKAKAEWEKTHYVHEVYAYIHSGVRLRLDTGEGFPDRQWDVSMCGYCLVTRDASEVPEPLKYAEGIIEEWNQYLSGDVWGYDIALYELQADADGDAIEERTYYERHAKHISEDSCWGFYGDEYALQETKSNAEAIVNRLRKAA